MEKKNEHTGQSNLVIHPNCANKWRDKYVIGKQLTSRCIS